MKSLHSLFAVFFFTLAISFSSTAQISVDPYGFTVTIEQDAETDVEFTLNNSGNEDVEYKMSYEAISEEEERLIGPRRDEPGEILRELRVPYYNTVGLAWDPENQWMWALAWSDSRLYAYDIEEQEVVVNVAVRSVLSMFYVDGVLYVGGYNNASNTIYRYDTQGRNIGNWRIPRNLTWTHIAGDENYIYTITYPNGGGEGDVHVFELQDNPDEVGEIDCSEWIGENGYGVESIPCHRRGHLWLSDRENLYQFSVDEEWNADLVQQFETVNSGHCGLAHDGLNLWRGIYDGETRMWYMIDDGELESLGFVVEPTSGTVSANDTETIGVHISSVNCEVGVYHVLLSIELSEPEQERDDLAQSSIEISAVLSIGEPTYSITGVVTDAENDVAVEDVSIEPECYSIIRTTNENGEYSIEDLPPGAYEFTFSAPDYLPAFENVEIGEDDVELDVALLHSECTPSQDEFTMQLEPGHQHEFEFRVDNGGNGPLTYSTERRLLGDANAAPFEIRQSDVIEEMLGDDMLAGAAFANGQFYISGGNNGENVNKIYVINMEGEVVCEFDQFAEDRYGMRDLAFDEELLWGAVEGTFYGFTTEGELITEFSTEADVEGRALAWDPVNEVLLASDISSEIFAINRNGELVETYQNPDLRIYGLGVWPDDPDGYYLYVFCRGPDNDGINIFRLNPENGDHELAHYCNVEGRPSGIQITNQFDVYSWVIVGLVQNPDELTVWQLDANYNWFRITPTEGIIEADSQEDFVLTLDATGLPANNDYESEIVFHHDGVGYETILDVTLSVEEGRVQTERDINLRIGWNTVSVNIQPNDHENIEGLVADLVESGQLIMMKNGNGDFYRPDYEFNSIPGWYSYEGYQMLISEAAWFAMRGESVMFDDPIELEEGWNLISYYPRIPVETAVALHNILDHLVIAKDGYGNFFLPAWDNFDNIGEMRPGLGYFVNVDTDCELRYSTAVEEERNASIVNSKSVYDKPGQLPVHKVTSENMSLLVQSYVSIEGEIGVYVGDELVGSGILQNGVCGIAVWGDDFTTKKIDGAIPGDNLEIQLLTEEGLKEVDYTPLDGKMVYNTNGYAVLRLDGISEIPLEFGITSAYPNPFNSQMRISYNLLETGIVDLAAYDVTGRRVAELTSGRQTAGVHNVMFDGKSMPSGVYMLRLQSGGQSSMMKVMLVK